MSWGRGAVQRAVLAELRRRRAAIDALSLVRLARHSRRHCKYRRSRPPCAYEGESCCLGCGTHVDVHDHGTFKPLHQCSGQRFHCCGGEEEAESTIKLLGRRYRISEALH